MTEVKQVQPGHFVSDKGSTNGAPIQSGLVWEIPPPPPVNDRRGRDGYYIGLLAPLIDRPMEWARVDERHDYTAASQAARNMAGRRVKIPAGRWEFTAREIDGRGFIYARYLGLPDGEEPDV